MRRTCSWRLAALAGLMFACHPLGSARAEPPQPPPYYAIVNVRVVTGTGKTLEGATVLLSNGLIEAVGTRVDVPADAWRIEGKGLTLYPGLIDALTSFRQKKEEEGSSRGGGGPSDSEQPPVRGPEDRPKTTPWVRASDGMIKDPQVAKWRQAGFTSTVAAPREGIFAGQAAFLDLGEGDLDETVVSTPVAQRLNFRSGGGFREYPGSLMGVLAYIEQVLEDTHHYTQVKSDYAKDPTGRVRPTYDRTLEPLEVAVDHGEPFLMPGNLGREIDRALALARDYDLDCILYGGQGAYSRVETLKASKTSVLVSLNWPEEEKDRDPEADTPIRTLIHRRLAVTTPRVLAEAGVPFAFYSDGLSTPAEVFESLRKAIEAGLGEQEALTALTRGAATLFGVEDRLGTIEKGKVANVVLANDWPWADGVEVKAVFVDGRKFQEHEDETPHEAPAQDISGTWSLTLQAPRGSREMTADLTMSEDGKVTGEIESERGTTTLEDGRMSADLLRFKTTQEFGGRSVTMSWTLTVLGETLSGTASAGPMTMDVSGERTGQAEEGAGEESESTEEKPTVPESELRAALKVVQGMAKPLGSFAVTNAMVWTVSGETIDGGTVVVIDGKIDAVGRDVKIPRGIEVIDAQGGALTPGIIDCHSHIAIEGGVNEGTLAVTSMVAVADVVNPDDIALYRALAGGVTCANLLHGSANPIGGTNQVIKLRWGQDAEGLKFAGAPPGIKFALGENPKRSNAGGRAPQRYPQTRMGVMDVIREAFTEAREYRREWDAYDKGAKRSGVKPMRPRRDLKLEPLVEVLDGKRLVHAHCYRADEILQLMRLAEEFGFRVCTLQHVLEGYKVADEIAAHGAGASTFSDWWGYKVEAYEAIPYNAALMAERGVLVSINSDSPEEMRHLNQEAGKCVKWGGMDERAALAMVTLNPAKQLHIDDRVGSIEVGKDADLVLFDGPPLSIQSVVQKTFIDGDLYFDRQADRKRQALIDDLKARLMPKSNDEETAGDTSGAPGAAEDSGSKPPPEVRWSADATYSCREER